MTDFLIQNYSDIDIVKLTKLLNTCFKSSFSIEHYKHAILQRLDLDIEGSIIVTNSSGDYIANYTLAKQVIFIEHETFTALTINYVATHPDYAGKGLAKKLTQMAIDYAENQSYDGLLLSADVSYHALKIYEKKGFKEVKRLNILFRPVSAKNVLFYLKFPFTLLVPISVYSYIREKLYKQSKILPQELNVDLHESYFEKINEFYKDYNGSIEYSPSKWKWIETAPTALDFSKTFVILDEKENTIIAGCRVKALDVYIYSRKFKTGVISDLFAFGKNEKETKMLQKTLIGHSLKFLKKKNIPIALTFLSPLCSTYKDFKRSGFISVAKSAYMIHSLSEKLKKNLNSDEINTKPWYYIHDNVIGIP